MSLPFVVDAGESHCVKRPCEKTQKNSRTWYTRTSKNRTRTSGFQGRPTHGQLISERQSRSRWGCEGWSGREDASKGRARTGSQNMDVSCWMESRLMRTWPALRSPRDPRGSFGSRTAP